MNDGFSWGSKSDVLVMFYVHERLCIFEYGKLYFTSHTSLSLASYLRTCSLEVFFKKIFTIRYGFGVSNKFINDEDNRSSMFIRREYLIKTLSLPII